jgi:NADP-dependent 3-hydroxy acid dehydrogenase YdfG
MQPHSTSAILITGASSGIGRATALLLDSKGYQVFAGVRKIKDGQILQNESKGNITPVSLDVTVSDQINQAVCFVTDHIWPSITSFSLINNAGIGIGGPIEFLPIDDFRRQVEVNLVGLIDVTQSFLPMIRRSKGKIINIGSLNGRIAFPFSGAYVATKFALEGISDTLRLELSPWKIKVILIEPGAIKTSFLDRSFQESNHLKDVLSEKSAVFYEKETAIFERFLKKVLNNAISPEAVAKVIYIALTARRPKTRYAVGLDAKIGILGKLLPDHILDKLILKAIHSGITFS